MSMMWVKKQSKWAIVAAALLIGGSLIMMDLPSQNGMSGTTTVGEVEGEEISAVSYQQDLQNYLRNEEARTGRQPEGAEYAQIRQTVFNFRVQNLMLAKLAKAYELRATVEEMQNWIAQNPREVGYSLAQYQGVEAVPYFLRDSTIDIMAYRNWLTQDSVYDRPGMRAIEEQLKTTLIQQLQLQSIFRSQVHRTDLEEAFLLETRENKAVLRYYRVPAGSFTEVGNNPDDAALKAHFEANPDSFWFPQDAARLAFVRLPLTPSPADSALMRNFAAELRERATGGESFEELARSYSGDAGSQAAGGKLPPAARGEWVPEFAAAAFALAPGEISQPVLSPFGYHLIQMHGITKVDGVEKAEVSHILLNITTGTESADSVLAAAEDLREQANKSGLAQAAKASGYTVEKTPLFAKASPAPLGRYVQGAISFAFSPAERKQKISEALQNEEAVYVLERDAFFEKGRDFERSRNSVAADYMRAKRAEAAVAEAKRVRGQVASAKELPATVGRAILETSMPVSSEAYVPGFGFGGAGLFQAIRQKVGEWGPVIATAEGAVFAQVVEAMPLPTPEKGARIQAARNESDMFQTSNLYQQWAQDLPKSARIKNTLDEVYRN
jgi:peptidyl-prolyl cis-trans isomerase D